MGNLDIAEKLMPNILTIVVQLCATYVIYVMYKKHLHEPVQAYLAKRKAYLATEVEDAQALKAASIERDEASQAAYQEAMLRIKKAEQDMIYEAEAKKKSIIASAQDEIDRRTQQIEQDLAEQRENLYREARQYVLEVAVDVNRKVLEDVDIDNAQMIDALEKEMNAHDYKH